MRFLSFDRIDSTNAEARRLAETGDVGPLWIRADVQTAGRGRRARSWVSEPGNLFCTGLYPQFDQPADTALLSFVAALAVYDTLAEYVPAHHIGIKWPNDVLIKRKKVSGILLESGQGSPVRGAWVAIGVGINLVSSPDLADRETTSVIDHMQAEDLNTDEPRMTGPDAAMAVLAARFEHWRTVLMRGGFAPVRTAWSERAEGLPGPVTVNLAQESFTGQALGLGPSGELRVEVKPGTVRDVHSGDIFFA